MNRTISSALGLQGRVLWSLCLREIHGRHGKFKIGYLWQIIRIGFSIAAFWWIRELGGFHASGGLSTPLFLLTGFIPWFIFSECIQMIMDAVQTNRALLTFPQITPLDLCLSCSLVAAATQFVVFLLYMAMLALLGYEATLHSPQTFLAALLGVTLLGTGTGLVLAALNHYLPVLEKLVPMVLRIMFFVSGVFFSPAQMAARFGDAVMWLPTANYIELLRGAFTGSGIPDAVKLEYTVAVTIVICALGLLLERHVRPLHEIS